MSPEAKDLIARLLVPSPKQRLTAAAALAHPWMRAPRESLPQARLSLTQVNLAAQLHSRRPRMRAAVAAIVAAQRLRRLPAAVAAGVLPRRAIAEDAEGMRAATAVAASAPTACRRLAPTQP